MLDSYWSQHGFMTGSGQEDHKERSVGEASGKKKFPCLWKETHDKNKPFFCLWKWSVDMTIGKTANNMHPSGKFV